MRSPLHDIWIRDMVVDQIPGKEIENSLKKIGDSDVVDPYSG